MVRTLKGKTIKDEKKKVRYLKDAELRLELRRMQNEGQNCEECRMKYVL